MQGIWKKCHLVIYQSRTQIRIERHQRPPHACSTAFIGVLGIIVRRQLRRLEKAGEAERRKGSEVGLSEAEKRRFSERAWQKVASLAHEQIRNMCHE